MPTLATLADLEARLGEVLSGADQGRAEAALEDASAIVRGYAGKTWDSGAPEAVVAIALRVARRLYTNPDGFAQESLGAASQRRPDQDAGALLTGGERLMLDAALSASGRWAYTIRTPSAYEGG